MSIKPKSRQVEDRIARDIRRGVWKAGDQLPSERELLDRFGVSRTTLREAFVGLARRGLIQRRQRSGTYVTQESATAGRIAIVAYAERLSAATGFIFQETVRLASQRIEESGYRPVLKMGRGPSRDSFYESLHMMEQETGGDVVGVLSFADLKPGMKELSRAGIPVVHWGRHVSEGQYRVINDIQAMVPIVQREMSLSGHERYAVVYTDNRNRRVSNSVKSVYEGVIDSLTGGREDLRVPVPFSPNYEAALEVFAKWYQSPGRPDAVFFLDDALCDVATRAMLSLNLSLPQDLSVMTLANRGRMFHYPTTFVRVGFDPQKLVDVAWDCLQKQLRGETPTQFDYMIKPELMPGDSMRHSSIDSEEHLVGAGEGYHRVEQEFWI